MRFAVSVQKSIQLKFRQPNLSCSDFDEVLKCIFKTQRVNVRQWRELRLETKKERSTERMQVYIHTHIHMRPHPHKNLGCM